MNIQALKEPSSEWQLAPLLLQMLDGIDTDLGHRIVLQKANVSLTGDDQALYETDFNISADGKLAGYLDSERKVSWLDGEWPYPKINIAIHPMKHWEDGSFGERTTNKLRSFQKAPDFSWAFLHRADHQAALMVLASDIFAHGQSGKEQTKYSATPLKVLEVPNRYGVFVSSAEEVAEVIERRWNDLLG